MVRWVDDQVVEMFQQPSGQNANATMLSKFLQVWQICSHVESFIINLNLHWEYINLYYELQ